MDEVYGKAWREYQYDSLGNLTYQVVGIVHPGAVRIVDGGLIAHLIVAVLHHIALAVGDLGDAPEQVHLEGGGARPVNALGAVTAYTYDGNGNLVSKKDADGYETKYTYNALDFVTQINYNGGKQASYRYNKVGELVEMEDLPQSSYL